MSPYDYAAMSFTSQEPTIELWYKTEGLQTSDTNDVSPRLHLKSQGTGVLSRKRVLSTKTEEDWGSSSRAKSSC